MWNIKAVDDNPLKKAAEEIFGKTEKREIVIIIDNPAAVTCTCALCEFHREICRAFAAKVDQEIMALCDNLNK